ncbi:hypothetical protein ACFQJD_04775 [Haloplanus sp. GCM10025708]|uniref:hypothetical protein n=1 Tax=Haloplanus sp. GCM10025708 TaxID=3252679 RepID=UPI003611319B
MSDDEATRPDGGASDGHAQADGGSAEAAGNPVTPEVPAVDHDTGGSSRRTVSPTRRRSSAGW